MKVWSWFHLLESLILRNRNTCGPSSTCNWTTNLTLLAFYRKEVSCYGCLSYTEVFVMETKEGKLAWNLVINYSRMLGRLSITTKEYKNNNSKNIHVDASWSLSLYNRQWHCIVSTSLTAHILKRFFLNYLFWVQSPLNYFQIWRS